MPLKNVKPKAAPQQNPETHYASRTLSCDFWHYQKQLPDADKVLQRIGYHSGQLKDFILADIQVQAVWGNTRLPFLSQAPWSLVAGGESRRAKQAAESLQQNLCRLTIHNIIEQLLDAVALGYSVAEIIWRPELELWQIADLVPKPSHWFRFGAGGELIFRTKGALDGDVMPAENFLVLKHRANYANPYGDKLFSKLYWPVLFKKHGLEWWVKFLERFGALSYFGKYDMTATAQQQDDLLYALEALLSSSVAIGPENTQITTVGDQQRWQGSAVHKDFEDWIDKAIAKAVLGQNLSSDSGEKGTQSLGNIQFRVLEAIAKSDQRLIASAFNELSRRYTDYNYGREVPAPIFRFEQKEDLKRERVERDEKLYAIGWRPQPEYIEQHYGIPAEQFAIESSKAGGPTFAQARPFSFSAEEKSSQEQFAQQLAGSGQAVLDDMQEDYFAILEQQNDFKGAFKALSKAYQAPNQQRKRVKFAAVIENLRHVSRNIGADDAAPQ